MYPMMKNKMRMKAMDSMMAEKPENLEQMRKKKIEQRLQSGFGDLMKPEADEMEDDGLEDLDMNGQEGEQSGFTSMNVSPQERKMLLMYRKHQKMKSSEMDSEDMEEEMA